MKFTIATLAVLLTAVSAMPTAEADNLLDRRQCGTINGPCDANNCNGWNIPSSGSGICRSGQYAGCPCATTCGNAIGSCNANDCAGQSGVCQGGKYAGCNCFH
ncbi:hypothetical protein B0T16DRAFT_388545 [Cercophora newfieldiana]|uniref:Uncharacterized protein n=1 Tax=Cercophora newfieldiana TaxID=92897 RepID=A0AA39YAB7_9PEZI|nr:hypothetical protein B0T16DRAFT_388545 [Cercophora newfieldiana]